MNINDFLKKVSFFAHLSDHDLNYLSQMIEVVQLPAGAQLFAEGVIGDRAYIIREGQIEILKTSAEGQVLLAVRQAGDLIGEMSLLDKAPRLGSARARTASVLLAVRQEQFNHLLNTSPSAAQAILGIIIPRWRNVETVLQQNEQIVREQAKKLEQALAALQTANDELEQRVAHRTVELAQANAILQRHIVELKQAEQERLQLSAIQRELAIAHEIQTRLLPPAKPDWPDLDVICYSTPAHEVGGDLYDYHALGDNRFAMIIGDVSGKGIPAALLMAMSLASFQATVGQNMAPEALLAHLDQAIGAYTGLTGPNCALIYAEISLPPPTLLNEDNGRILRVANAGCIPPLIRRVDGSVEWVDVRGIPLGLNFGTAQPGYEQVHRTLATGDLLILTSDGVVEAHNAAGHLFGFERLEQAVAAGSNAGPETMLEHLKREIAAFRGDTELYDDLTIVVVRV